MFDTHWHYFNQDRVKALSLKSTNQTAYPLKLVRYWLVGNLLASEGGELDIAEVGIDKGQMKYWIDNIGSIRYRTWDGYDIHAKPEVNEADYSNIFLGDATDKSWAPRKTYGCFILLHFLEHLENPEHFLESIDPYLRQGGTILGGMPSSPEFIRSLWEAKLRSRAKPFGHVSVFSRTRLEKIAERFGYEIEYLSGGFFIRNDGSRLENSRYWFKFNHWFALQTCAVGNEMYFKMRKK